MFSVYQLVDTVRPWLSYIGQTGDLEKRMSVHKSRMKGGVKSHLPLYAAMRRDGFKNFKLIVLAEFKTQREARDHERDLIEEREPALNVYR